MKKFTLIAITFLFSTWSIFSQIPDWYAEEMKRMVGTWTASNEAYMTENETDDAYAIRWDWGVGKQSLVGVLYGLKNDEKTNEYWQFFQYWDAENKKVRVIQVAAFGTQGIGYMEGIGANKTQLVQVFTNPDGSSYRSGHRTEVFEDREISSSFDIDAKGNWVSKRSYTWYKGS